MNELERVVAEVATTQEAMEKAVAHRDMLIRKLLPSVGATALAKVTHLTRGRIYQIAEHRR